MHVSPPPSDSRLSYCICVLLISSRGSKKIKKKLKTWSANSNSRLSGSWIPNSISKDLPSTFLFVELSASFASPMVVVSGSSAGLSFACMSVSGHNVILEFSDRTEKQRFKRRCKSFDV